MKKHHFHETIIKHHKDGSGTMHHKHESDPKKDVEHAVADLDGMHDSMEQNLGEPNQGEDEMAQEAGAAGQQQAPPQAGM